MMAYLGGVHQHHVCRKIDTICTQDKIEIMAYLVGVSVLRVCTAIILFYVANSMSNIHANNVRKIMLFIGKLKGRPRMISNANNVTLIV